MNSLSDFLGESPSTYRSFLIVGANGMLDLCDNEAVKQVVAKGFHVVVNCSAYSNVDGAESDPEAADAVNHQAVKTLADCCLQTETMLLHYSTDYVFCGHADQPYRVDAEIDPINEYGRSKAAGERAVRESGCSHLIARTSWLYVAHGNNFVRTMFGLMQSKSSLKVVDDQVGRPTCVGDLAHNSLKLLAQGASGTLHLTDSGQCSWYQFACQIRDAAKLSCEINPCTSEEFPRPAPRPAYSLLDLSLTERYDLTLPPWQAGVRQVVQALVAQRESDSTAPATALPLHSFPNQLPHTQDQNG